MKGLWIIAIILITLMLFFVLSRKSEKSVEMPEDKVVSNEGNMVLPVIGEDVNVLYDSESKFRVHMKFLDEYDDALEVAIESQNWDDISKYAMLLKNTSPLIFTGKRKVELPKDFILLDTSFHFQSLAVVEAAQSREMVRLNIEYDKLQKTCDDCHVKYKKKD